MNRIKMILVFSFSFIILRSPANFQIFFKQFYGKSVFWSCYYFPLSIRLYDSFFLIQIFNYYFFNKIFRSYIRFRTSNDTNANDSSTNTSNRLRIKNDIHPIN
jgi:hypothetical protein